MLLAWVVALRDAVLAVLLGFIGVELTPARGADILLAPARGEAALASPAPPASGARIEFELKLALPTPSLP
jgi:hypothetical protein